MKHALAPWMLAAGSALAAPVQIQVTGPDGKPAADVAVMVQPSGSVPAAAAGEVLVVEQREIRFVPFVTAVPLGGTVRFVNKDRFDHHVRSLPGGPLGTIAPAKTFDFRMAGSRIGADAATEIKFDQPGVVALGCHLHGSMRGHIVVSVTPHVAVTDDRGRATIANVPDGAADVRLWHPEQLSDQQSLRITVAAGAPRAEAKLNFSPRPRPAPQTRKLSEYE
jgi:plastocyanin